MPGQAGGETNAQKAARVAGENAPVLAQLRADGHSSVDIVPSPDPGYVLLTLQDGAGSTFTIGDPDGDVVRMARQARAAIKRHGVTPKPGGS